MEKCEEDGAGEACWRQGVPTIRPRRVFAAKRNIALVMRPISATLGAAEYSAQSGAGGVVTFLDGDTGKQWPEEKWQCVEKMDEGSGTLAAVVPATAGRARGAPARTHLEDVFDALLGRLAARMVPGRARGSRRGRGGARGHDLGMQRFLHPPNRVQRRPVYM